MEKEGLPPRSWILTDTILYILLTAPLKKSVQFPRRETPQQQDKTQQRWFDAILNTLRMENQEYTEFWHGYSKHC